MTPHALLFTLAAIGISEVVYLIRTRKAHEKPVCVLGSRCNVLLESKYNKIFGIHNDILGLLFYIGISLMTALLVIGVGPLQLLDTAVKLMIAGGTLMSLFLLYVQWQILKAWCFWCIMSALTIFLMGTIVLTGELVLQ